MKYRIEVQYLAGQNDPRVSNILSTFQDLRIRGIDGLNIIDVFNINGKVTKTQANQIAAILLKDPVVQTAKVFSYPLSKTHFKKENNIHRIEIAHYPGVMDPTELSALKAANDLGIDGVTQIRSAKLYLFEGSMSAKNRKTIIERVLSNKLIESEVDPLAIKNEASKPAKEYKPTRIEVDLLDADDKELMRLSQDGQLYLNLSEMKAIQKHFKKIGRKPSDIELETIAQTWSEHCFHKTFRGNIDYTYIDSKGKKKNKKVKNLLKSTIAKATFELNKPWCVSVFHDNAGVIKFDKEHHVCFKVETHNHPSALEPFGGANTGIGGVVRDTLGTGLGAKPIANTDVFCFAPPDVDYKDLPPGTLHPKRIMDGVVSGVRDYGNKMGIPTVNGAILFDEKYIGNPLVYCGNVGLIPKDCVKKQAQKGDLVVVVGGKTGRDGIHGATFSSGELTEDSEVVSSGAVQIGNPIEEKKIADALLQARDLGLYTAITDCGAGGLSSAGGEMGEELGVRIDLEKVPLKYDGLTYTEIWISESQERMVMSVSPKKIKKFLKVFETENVEATVIGEFTGRHRLELYYNDVQVGDLSMDFLYDGNPRDQKTAEWKTPKLKSAKLVKKPQLGQALKNVLSHYNVCSKEKVVRQYDHEVQGGSVVKPFVGVNCDGPSDAAVVSPKLTSKKGVAISNGINIRYGMIDPYWMSLACIDEAIRQIVSVGGDPEQIAILDNFCWGNPDKPDRLGSLVRCAEGCYKAAVGFGTPFISGKDSLYNEFAVDGKSIAIPGTLLISAIGHVKNVEKCVTMDFKESGNLIYAVGTTYDELGGSIYLDTLNQLGENVPEVRIKTANKIFAAMHQAINKGLIRSSHDCSEGGLGVAVAEMAFAGGFGADIDLTKVPFRGNNKRDDVILFSESNSRFIVEVDPKNKDKFKEMFKGLSIKKIGCVTNDSSVQAKGLDGKIVLNENIEELKKVWKEPLS